MGLFADFVRAVGAGVAEERRPPPRCDACGKRISFCPEACGFCIACCTGHDDERQVEAQRWGWR